MVSNNEQIIGGVYALIDNATNASMVTTKNAGEFHKAIIKKFFNASSVTINYDSKEICLGVDMLSKDCDVKITYKDLNTFLKSCLRTTQQDMTFYKNMLHYYSTRDAVA